MPELLATPDAVDTATLARLRAWATSSVYVGASPLKGSFRESRGFAITFTRDGLPELERRFPELWPFFARSLSRASWGGLFGAGERALMRLRAREPRAWYFNLLSVPAGASVGAHVDATLSWVTGREGVSPLLVSVLYLSAPPGGALALWRGEARVAEVEPRPGTLLHFRGELGHEVRPVAEDAGEARLSLVCEQYDFTPQVAARLQPLQVTSRGLFERYLARGAG